MGKNLFNKVWDLHKVTALSESRDQLFIGLHLVHEVTSPQAFAALRERNLSVKYPDRTLATVDHIVPTQKQLFRPYKDDLAEKMLVAIEDNTKDFGIQFFGLDSDSQGIVHIIGPENLFGIVKNSIDQLGGEINFETRLNKGSQFILKLPLFTK